MSTTSDSQDCPKCGGSDSLMTSMDTRPYISACGECIECGFVYWTATDKLNLAGLNDMRADRDLDPVEAPAKWIEDEEVFKCRCCGEKKAGDYCCESDQGICLDCCEDDCEDSREEREEEIINPCKCCGAENDGSGKFCSDCHYDMDRERQDQEAETEQDEPKE